MKLKNIPQPQNPLKSFNWAKLADNKLAGTLWTNLDDTKLYSRLDLAEIGVFLKPGVELGETYMYIDGELLPGTKRS